MVSWLFLFISGTNSSFVFLLFSIHTQTDSVRATVQSAGKGSAPEMVSGHSPQREEEDTARAGSDYSLA